MGVPEQAMIYISIFVSPLAPCNSKPQTVQAHTGTYSAVLPPATHPPSQYSAETTPAEYSHQYTQQYTQVTTTPAIHM